jgi:hypothetical protein
MRRLTAIILIASSVLVAGCGDDRPCLKEEEYTYLMPYYFAGIDKPPTFLPTPGTRCIEYGPVPPDESPDK